MVYTDALPDVVQSKTRWKLILLVIPDNYYVYIVQIVYIIYSSPPYCSRKLWYDELIKTERIIITAQKDIIML